MKQHFQKAVRYKQSNQFCPSIKTSTYCDMQDSWWNDIIAYLGALLKNITEASFWSVDILRQIVHGLIELFMFMIYMLFYNHYRISL